MKHDYLPRFQNAKANAADHYTLTGDFILVEEIKDEEFKTKSGIIIAQGPKSVLSIEADRPTFARVLLVGSGYYDRVEQVNPDTGAIEFVEKSFPLDCEPGDIILVSKHDIKKFSVFGRLVSYGETELGLSRAESIQMRFKGQRGFDEFFRCLNQAPETPVEPGSQPS